MLNRLNVSISRAKWKAHLVCSLSLLDQLPNTPQGLAELSAFARLSGAGQETRMEFEATSLGSP
jgi:superfamily I DNA and/or RNA helicase